MIAKKNPTIVSTMETKDCRRSRLNTHGAKASSLEEFTLCCRKPFVCFLIEGNSDTPLQGGTMFNTTPEIGLYVTEVAASGDLERAAEPLEISWCLSDQVIAQFVPQQSKMMIAWPQR